MDELRQSILYGCLPIELTWSAWSLPQQLEIVRYLVANPSSVSRIRAQDTPNDWVATLVSRATSARLESGGSASSSKT
jgi:hypothetical protein